MSDSRQELEKWLKGIDVKVPSVLDIGGYIWSVKGKVKNWEVTLYNTLGLDERADIVLDLSSTPFTRHGGYEVIFCTEVMQFIYNPYNALELLSTMLVPEGILYINFHKKYIDCKGNDYLRYTRKGVERLLKETGFQILYFQPVKGKDFESYFVKCKRLPKPRS